MFQVDPTSPTLGHWVRKNIEFNGKDAFKYENEELTSFKFHVDYHECLAKEWEMLGVEEPQYGENLSVREKESEKPIIMFGQDECIFKQYLFTYKHWALPNVTILPMPKEGSQGIMLSSFVSREFGYRFEMTSSQLSHVNQYQKGQHYLDVSATMEINKSTEKSKLTSTPFILYFNYGANSNGYWNYSTIDVVDVLVCLFGNTYTFVFCFDHSSGYNKNQPDGLNSNKINEFFVVVNAK